MRRASGKTRELVSRYDDHLDLMHTLRWRESLRVPPCDDDDCDDEACLARTGLSRRLREVAE